MNVTGQVDEILQELEADIVSNVTNALGIHDVYNIYLQNICEGDFGSDNTALFTACPTYEETIQGTSLILTSPH
jgi:hypothetical protein